MSKSKIKYVLGMDCETSGLFFSKDVDRNYPDPSYNPITKEHFQSVSWGLIVFDPSSLKLIDELYVKIKWNGESNWSLEAERVHGLSRKHLEETGMSEEEAAVTIGEFIFKYWSPSDPICTMGHNVMTFDHHYFRRLMNKFGIMPKFGNRHIDTNSIGMAVFDTDTSDELFELIGVVREQHNALEDIKASFEAFKLARRIGNKALGV